jgi:hypothetical protein
VAWLSYKHAVDSGTTPQPGLKGKECAPSNKFKCEVEPGLKLFFKTVVIPLSGPGLTCPKRQQSGAIEESDFEGTSKLDPEGMKRRLFGQNCFDQGYLVRKESTMKIKRRVHNNWLALGAEYGNLCLWRFFWNYSKRNHPKLIVCKPGKDISGLCYQFHL